MMTQKSSLLSLEVCLETWIQDRGEVELTDAMRDQSFYTVQGQARTWGEASEKLGRSPHEVRANVVQELLRLSALPTPPQG